MLGVTHVLNAASMQDSDKKIPLVRYLDILLPLNVLLINPCILQWLSYRALGLEDNYSQPILHILDEVISYINDIQLNGGKILIHCQAGISRSAALICAYLMKVHKISFSEGSFVLQLPSLC